MGRTGGKAHLAHGTSHRSEYPKSENGKASLPSLLYFNGCHDEQGEKEEMEPLKVLEQGQEHANGENTREESYDFLTYRHMEKQKGKVPLNILEQEKRQAYKDKINKESLHSSTFIKLENQKSPHKGISPPVTFNKRGVWDFI